MRVLAASLVALAAGCTFDSKLTPDGNNVTGEAGAVDPDAQPPDAPPLENCTNFSTVLNACEIGTYGAALSLSGSKVYDTGTHELADDPGGNPTTPMFRDVTIGGNQITLLVLEGFTLQSAARLRVIGPRAFGIVSTGTITIVGTIDATDGGAGARSATVCMTTSSEGKVGGNNNSGSGGASGGGGGGFRGMGGKGGLGDNNAQDIEGGAGGAALALAPTIIGGCPGGRGGNQQNQGTGGAGGAPGGGVLLISKMQLSIPGVVNAGGGGGKAGAGADGGGGGGGSAGMIVLEAPAIMINGFAVANGGSGGAGAGDAAGQDGNPGTISALSASGGLASGGGGSGGNGGATAQNNGLQPGNANDGGGGGGGGVGYVTMMGTMTITGIVSPPPTTWPF